MTIASTSNHENEKSNCICPPGFGGLDCEIREKIYLFCIDVNIKYNIFTLYSFLTLTTNDLSFYISSNRLRGG